MFRPEIDSARPFDSVFNCVGAPNSYFTENLLLLRAVKKRHEEVIERLKFYLDFVKDETHRVEITNEIERRDQLMKKVQEQRKKQCVFLTFRTLRLPTSLLDFSLQALQF